MTYRGVKASSAEYLDIYAKGLTIIGKEIGLKAGLDEGPALHVVADAEVRGVAAVDVAQVRTPARAPFPAGPEDRNEQRLQVPRRDVDQEVLDLAAAHRLEELTDGADVPTGPGSAPLPKTHQAESSGKPKRMPK